MNGLMAILVLMIEQTPDPLARRSSLTEKIFVQIPEFYLNYQGYFTPIQLKRPSSKVIRRYFLIPLNSVGQATGKRRLISEEEFYRLAEKVLDIGLPDSQDASFDCEQNFQDFIKTLVAHGIVDQEALKAAGQKYASSRDFESLYFLDEAAPDLFTEQSWNNFSHEYRFGYHGEDANTESYRIYHHILIGIKIDRSPAAINQLRAELDGKLQEALKTQDGNELEFWPWAKSYSELSKKGAVLASETQRLVFRLYLKYHHNWKSTRDAYRFAGMPLPSAKVSSATLEEYLKAADKPVLSVVKIFRDLELNFPKELAGRYRDATLQDYGILEDIDYLLKMAEEDAEPELWKKYADDAMGWHYSPENRKNHKDSGDYFHLAVEGHRRIQEYLKKADIPANWTNKEISKRIKYLRLSKGEQEQLLGAIDDPTVRMRDLLVAYELVEKNPKRLIAIFDKRLERFKDLLRGVVSVSNGKAYWLINEFGQHLIPFADEIELAAYLKNSARTNKLNEVIAQYVDQKFKEAGEKIYVSYRERFQHILTRWRWSGKSLREFWEIVTDLCWRWEEFYQEMCSSNTPIYFELNEILDLYQSLGYAEGALSLAYRLSESVGYDFFLVRRAYHLGGLGREVEEQYYGSYSDTIWLERQARFNLETRMRVIQNRLKKK